MSEPNAKYSSEFQSRVFERFDRIDKRLELLEIAYREEEFNLRKLLMLVNETSRMMSDRFELAQKP